MVFRTRQITRQHGMWPMVASQFFWWAHIHSSCDSVQPTSVYDASQYSWHALLNLISSSEAMCGVMRWQLIPMASLLTCAWQPMTCQWINLNMLRTVIRAMSNACGLVQCTAIVHWKSSACLYVVVWCSGVIVTVVTMRLGYHYYCPSSGGT